MDSEISPCGGCSVEIEGILVEDARTTRCVDFYGHILLWPPQ